MLFKCYFVVKERAAFTPPSLACFVNTVIHRHHSLEYLYHVANVELLFLIRNRQRII